MRRCALALTISGAMLAVPYVLMTRGNLSAPMLHIVSLLFGPGVLTGLLLGMHLEDGPLHLFAPAFSMAFWAAIVWTVLAARERRRRRGPRDGDDPQ